MQAYRNSCLNRLLVWKPVLAIALFTASPAQSRQLKTDFISQISLLQANQKNQINGQSDESSATIQNYRLGSLWNGPAIGASHEGQIYFNHSQGEGVTARQVEISEILSLNRSRFNLQLTLTGLGRLSDGDLNLDLSEQVDRNRSLGILSNLNPGSVADSGNRLYEERYGINSQISYNINRRFQVNAGFDQQSEKRRDNFANASLSQNNQFQNINGGFRYRLWTRTFLGTSISQSQFVTSGSIAGNDADAIQDFRLLQNEESREVNLSHQFSRNFELGLVYFRLDARTEGLDPSSVEGPGMIANWQINRLNFASLQINRYRLQLGDDVIMGEFGRLQYRRILGSESELVVQIEKTYDSARANFEALANNQLALDSRRNRILQGLIQANHNWRKFQWTQTWTYLEYETPDFNPSFFEHRLTSEFSWRIDRERALTSGVELRQAENKNPATAEELLLYGLYANYQKKFLPNWDRKMEGLIEAGLRHDWSEEDVTGLDQRRLAVTLSAGLSF
ncbi:MAG: hypothetical protein ACOH5I_00965 [Oligoflexus sp.]